MAHSTASSRFATGVLLVASLAVMPAFALNAPKEWAHGFINGYFGLIAYTESGNQIEVQMKDKDAADETYRTVYTGAGSLTQYTYSGGIVNGNNYASYFPNMPGPLNVHRFATNVYTTVTCRMRAKNGGESSDWVDLGDSTGYLNVGGTWLGYHPNGNISDGNLQSMYDHDTALWVGMDFGRPLKIRGIRYYSRSDASYYRIYPTHFEYASDESFSDAVVAFNITSTTNCSKRKISELWFDEPVTTRYMRHVSSASQRSSLCELEFIPAEIPYFPTITCSYADNVDFHPQITWTTPAAAVPVRSRVLRATSESGEYTAVSDWLNGGAGSFTDTATLVSVEYFYKVEVECNHPAFQGEDDEKVVVSEAKSIRRVRRLDRDPSDETKLLDGVSLMACTNGTVNSVMGKAFDGKANTWPDTRDFYYGPIGLKFDKKTWVSRIGYICRTNQYNRIKMTALFSADASDVALDNKVQRSPRASQASNQPVLYYLDADSLPADGADQYFLWKCDGTTGDYDTFHGNVAELQFFGWNEDDVEAAGVLAPPTEMTFERLPTSLRIGWNAGSAVTGYVLQRRPRGGSEWTQVAETAKDVRTYEDAGLATGAYEYRIVAKGANDAAAESVPFTAVFYVAGSGTGLRSVVYAPFKAKDPTLCAPDRCYDRGVEAPNLVFAAADEFAPGSGVTSNAYSVMNGKLVVPFTGSYTFRFENANGCAVFIDRNWAVNSWCSGGKSGEIQLTAGEHDIEIHSRLESAANQVQLYWSGSVAEELVPASQLIPADAPYSFDYPDDWKVHFYSGEDLGSVWTNASGSVIIRAGNQDAGNWRTDSKTVFYAHECSTSFSLSGRVYDNKTGSGGFGLMVRAANGNFLRFYGVNGGTSYAQYRMCVLTNGATATTLVKGGNETTGTGHAMTCDMKLDYDSATGVFTASYMNVGSSEWTQFATWTNDGSIPRDFEVGYFVGGFFTGHDFGEVYFSNRVFKPLRGLLVIFR